MAEVYCFGRFTLNPNGWKLLADGTPTPVGATSVRVLHALVERAGQVVSKDDLMAHVWGRAAVGDNRLHVHVYELRKTIGDDSIVTKSGRGYRFVAQVQRRPASLDETPETFAPPRNGNLPSLRRAGEDEEPRGLIGRSEELRAIAAHLEDAQLLTLTGPGGVGKTTLSLHAASAVAQRFPDGVWLAELAALGDPDLVPAAVATVLGIKPGQSAAPIDALTRQLARKKLLLVLDNCEHVLSAAALLSEALARAAPDVRILASSREPLSCAGEKVFQVPPLAFPTDAAIAPEAIREMAAIRLFIERARNADSGFAIDDAGVGIAARICRRLDGLPLAIEMVSSWAGVLGLEALEARLDGSLKTWLRARTTAPARHSTLSATMEWSHDLSSPPERAVLRRLAVFAGGFTMEGAEAVAFGDDLAGDAILGHVASLVRKSMVALVPGTRSQRYRLMETTRVFALEKLAASGETEAVCRRHAQLMLSTLERACEEWESTSDAAWLGRYAHIIDDLRATLDWVMAHRPGDVVALAGASWPLWREFALHAEGREWLASAVALVRPDTPPHLEARLRRGFGELWTNSGAVRRAQQEFGRAADLYRALGDTTQLGAALSRLAFTSMMIGKGKDSESLNAEALHLLKGAAMPRSLASAHATQVCVDARLGRYEQARAEGEKAIRLCDAIGAERLRLVVIGNLMEFALEQGDVESSVEAGRALTTRLRDSAHSDVQAFVFGIMVAALISRGDLDEALVTARQAAPLLREEGMLFGLFDHLALRAALAGRPADAARLIGYSDAAHEAAGRPREPISRRAASRVDRLLQDALAESEIATLKSEGALLTEDHATALALRE